VRQPYVVIESAEGLYSQRPYVRLVRKALVIPIKCLVCSREFATRLLFNIYSEFCHYTCLIPIVKNRYEKIAEHISLA
jgi:hypothetical protein